ncbi:hypothetical protein KKA47_03335, partial [bacterium]|nr:hypothetical protein [bacterium]
MASQSKDQCLYQRHLITNLIPEVKQKTGINWEVIEKILSQKVNVPDDKFIAKPSEEFNKWNSISTFEVAGFVRRFWSSKRADEKAVGLALAQIYGIEEYFKTPPKPREITLLGAYDPDTITIIEKQSDDCDLPEVKYNMRISGVDAPEVDFKENFIPFLKAMVDQGNIFKIKGFNFTEEDPTIEENNDSISFMGEEAISPSLQKFYSDPWIRAILEKAAEYANDGQKIEMNFNGRKQKLPWTNPKLIQNIIKTFEAMGGAEGMSKQDQLNLLVLIGHYHTYGGQLGTIITNDYIHYIQDYKKLKFVSEESTTHFFT